MSTHEQNYFIKQQILQTKHMTKPNPKKCIVNQDTNKVQGTMGIDHNWQ